MKGLQTPKKAGFKHQSLHSKREPHPVSYLKQRTSFWIATMSLFTFVVGNMMGQHGWYAFWASVLGEEDNTAIAYTGTVPPFEQVVDYDCWAKYGGDWKVHTFRQAPRECLEPLPTYRSSDTNDILYSMQYMSSYADTTEGSGTHGGVDIRVPVGTPVRAVMNGRVLSVGKQDRGFGQYIVLEHPDVPDPQNPSGKTITLYSNYGHLSTQYVAKGDVVHKGDMIGLSGNTGYSTGPHLDFSLVREGAPFLPYYPTTVSDGYKYTVNPVLYVQSDYRPVAGGTLVASETTQRTSGAVDPEDVVAPRRVQDAPDRPVVARPQPQQEEQSVKTIIARLQSRREARLRERLALLETTPQPTTTALRTGVTTTVAVAEPETVVQSESTVVETAAGKVDTVEILHDGYFTGRGWEKVTVRLLDDDGNTVTAPRLDTDLVMRTEFGSAEFRPAVLSPLDFFKGEATVNVLPRGRRTVVIKVMPYGDISKPLQYE